MIRNRSRLTVQFRLSHCSRQLRSSAVPRGYFLLPSLNIGTRSPALSRDSTIAVRGDSKRRTRSFRADASLSTICRGIIAQRYYLNAFNELPDKRADCTL